MSKTLLLIARSAQSSGDLARTLKSGGFGVELAESERRACDLARSRQIDVAIVMLEGNSDVDPALFRDLSALVPEIAVVGGRNSRARVLRDCLPGLSAILSEVADPKETARRVRQGLDDQSDGTAAVPPVPMMLGFDGCILDLGGRSFRNAQGRDIPLGRAQFSLLTALVRNAGLVLSRDYLRQVVPGRGQDAFDRSIDMLVTRLRRKIEPDPKSPRFILTIPGEGYKFNVRPQEVAATEPSQASSTRPLYGDHQNQRLAIVVLPFTNLGGGAEDNLFAEALTESLTTELSRSLGNFVVGLKSASPHCGNSIDIRKLAIENCVSYAVRGSVQLSDTRIRLNVQLIDVRSSIQIWSDRLDYERDDLFGMLDRIAATLIRTLEVKLIAAEARSAYRMSSLDSTQLTFCGWDAYNRRRSLGNLRQAERCFTAALASNPENVHALTGLALTKSSYPYYFTDEECACDFAVAEAAALAAVELNPDLASTHYALSWVYTYSNRPELALAAAERALLLRQNHAHAHAVVGMANIFLGRADEAEHHILRALTLSPCDPFAYTWREFAGAAKIYLGEWGKAAAWFHSAPEAERSHPLHNFFLAAALAGQGRSTEASTAAQRGLALAPTFTLRRFQQAPLGNDPTYLAQRQRICEAMREAGVP